MASIERTAYPRFKRSPTPRELADVCTPTPADVAFVEATARGDGHRLSLLCLLKTFQRLGYMPRLDDIPAAIVAHMCAHRHLPSNVTLGYDSSRTLYRHHQAVRDYLQVTADGPQARHVAVAAMHEAAQVMDNPADLINVALDELIRRRYELPAFSTLDRLARRVRTLVNTRVFARVQARVSPEQRARLDHLLDTDNPRQRSDFNALKEPRRSRPRA